MDEPQSEAITVLEDLGAYVEPPVTVWRIRFDNEEPAQKLVRLIHKYQDPVECEQCGLPAPGDMQGSVYAEIVEDQETVQLEISNDKAASKLFSALKHQITEIIRHDDRATLLGKF